MGCASASAESTAVAACRLGEQPRRWHAAGACPRRRLVAGVIRRNERRRVHVSERELGSGAYRAARRVASCCQLDALRTKSEKWSIVDDRVGQTHTLWVVLFDALLAIG